MARLVMGGLFIFSGSAKLGFLEVFWTIGFLKPIAQAGIDPAQFAATIKAFAILHTDLIPLFTYTLPWVELICGTALVLGLMPRGAATIINLLLVTFCLAMLSVMIRDIDVECSCFGKFLGGKVGWLSLVRNAVFMAIMSPVAMWGGGYFALGSLLCPCRTDAGADA